MLLKNLFVYLHKGYSFARILLNTGLENIAIDGQVLDVGAGEARPPYFRHLRLGKRLRVTSLDIDPAKHPTVVADVEKRFPFPGRRFDGVLCMCLLEHVLDFPHVIREIRRVLKPEGQLVGAVPFIYPLHPFPHREYDDYFRFSEGALRALLADAGYKNITIQPHGFGPFSTGLFFLEYPYFFVLRWIPLLRFLLYLAALGLDNALFFLPLRLFARTGATPFVLIYTFRALRRS